MTQADVEQLRRALASEEGGRRWLRRLGVVGVLAVAVAGGLVYRAKHRGVDLGERVTLLDDAVEVDEHLGDAAVDLGTNVDL